MTSAGPLDFPEGVRVSINESLAPHTYYRIGGPADFMVQPISVEELKKVSRWAVERKIPLFYLGAGSNLLVADSGFRGLVVKANRISADFYATDEPNENIRLRVGSSLLISSFLNRCADLGYTGAEFLAGIPGTIGGAIVMNAGTHLGEISKVCNQVSVWSPETGERSIVTDPSHFSYRRNHFLKPGDWVESVTLSLAKAPKEQVASIVKEILIRRKNSQPVDLPSCGSVFKNPEGQHAWQVVDQLGLRGHRIGNAQISEKHCNFIVNLGGAKAQDVLSLIQVIQKRSQSELGVTLEREVQLLGEFDQI